MMIRILLLFLISSFTAPILAQEACPQTKLGESAEDCPWASIARGWVRGDDLQTLAPELKQNLQADLADRAALSVWGQSQNFEAAEKSAIVPDLIIRQLLQMAQLPAPQGVVVHAGVEHTYGYLLSNLKTSFGFKRQRWVRGDLEAGLNLTPGILGPEPKDGGFLRNISYFMGRIAFRNEPKMQSGLAAIGAAAELKAFSLDNLSIKRIEETIQVSAERSIRIHTDLVKLSQDYLLVYSYEDSAASAPVLISGFPINQGAYDALMIPNRFGDKVSIKPRYNVFIPGVSDKKSEWLGKRELF